MAHEISFYGALCSTNVFKVNGKNADYDDFGCKDDLSPETAEDYGCGNMTFTPRAPSAETLSKYGIDELEYWTIANALADGLSFGECGWCI